MRGIKMKESKKNCPHCGGKGEIAHHHKKVWNHAHLRRRDAYTSYSTCSHCNGIGEIIIPQEKQTIFKKV